MNSRIIKTWSICSIIGSLLITAVSPAVAQIEEIIVTANKREQTLQEVPIALSVISAEEITNANITNIFELQYEIPGFEARQYQNLGDAAYFIRGFGNGSNNPGVEPTVVVYIDGVPRVRMMSQISDLPNIERVEILKGPQNTIFGKNSSSGVINIVTKKPSDETEGKVSLEMGDYEARKFQAYLSGGLTDSTSASLALTVNKRDGYVSTRANDIGACTGNQGSPCTDLMDKNRKSARFDLYSELSDTLNTRISYDYSDIDELCCNIGNVVGGPYFQAVRAIGGSLREQQPFSYEYSPNWDPYNEIKNRGTALNITWDLGFATLNSVTSHRKAHNTHDYDLSFDSADLFANSPKIQDVDTFSQEIRLTSNDDDSPLTWLVGLFYSDEDLEFQDAVGYGPRFRNYVDVLAGGDGSGAVVDFVDATLGNLGYPGGSFAPPMRVQENFTQNAKASSIFGQVEYNITDKFTATLGLSYFQQKKAVTFEQFNSDLFAARDLVEDGFNLAFGLGMQQAVQGFLTQATQGFLAQAIPQYMQAGLSQEAATAAASVDAQAFAQTQMGAAMAFAQSISGTIAAGASAASTDPTLNPLLGFTPLQFLPPTIGFPNPVEDGKSKDTNVDYSIKLSYDIADNLTVYGGLATGFKGTAWNMSRGSSPTDAATVAALAAAGIPLPNNAVVRGRRVTPEEATIYEIGAKMRFEQGYLNIAYFDQTVEDFHSNTFIGASFILTNVEEQVSKGVEFDLLYQPFGPTLDFKLSGLIMECTYEEFRNAAGGDATGFNCEGVHEESFATSLTYKWESDAVRGFVRLGYQLDSAVNVRLPTDLGGDAFIRQAGGIADRERNVMNASIGVSYEGYDLLIWAKNLNNDKFLHTVAPNAATNDVITGIPTQWFGYPNEPRMWGATLSKQF